MNLFGNCRNDSWIWILIIIVLICCTDCNIFGGCNHNHCCCDKPCEQECC